MSEQIKSEMNHAGDCSIYCSPICDCGTLRKAASTIQTDEVQTLWAKHLSALGCVSVKPGNYVEIGPETKRHLHGRGRRLIVERTGNRFSAVLSEILTGKSFEGKSETITGALEELEQALVKRKKI